MTEHFLEVFMAPRSVAFIGATRRTGEGSFNILESMKRFGYPGKIYPVNPLAKEIMGMKAFREIKEIQEPIDLAIVFTPREQIPAIVEDCADLGIKGAIIVPQGFADADEEGRVLQDRLTRIARHKGIRILGPNTLGVINAFSGFTSSFVPLKRERVPVGVICQSGIFFVGSSQFTGAMGKGIDLGNGCDIDFADALEYFGEDDQIKMIFIHIEGMKEGRKFFEVSRRVSHRKPIIALKTARSQPGARAALSHSGALSGEHEIFEAALRQAGVISVQDAEEISDYTKAFLHLSSMRGKRVGVVTFSGAGGIILIDTFHEYGLELAALSSRTIQRIKELSPHWMSIRNPLDIWPALMKHGLKSVFRMALDEVLQDPAVDGVICTAVAPGLPGQESLDVTDVIKQTAASFPQKPVVVWLYGEGYESTVGRFEEGGKAICLPTLARAARVLSSLWRRQQLLQEEHSPLQRFLVAGDPREIVRRLADARDESIRGEAAHDLLVSYGIPVVKSRFCKDFPEILQAAIEVGYPVALKIVSRQIVHKTEVGGVILNLRGPEDLKQAHHSLVTDLEKKVTGAEIDGFLVQEIVSGGKEIILGAKRDPQFGPTLLFGTGGIDAEIWKDVSYGIAPLSQQDVQRMIQETRCFQILRGARGGRGWDVDFLAECLSRLSQLMLEREEVEEIDINPFMIYRQGGAAVDVRVIVGKGKER